MLDAMPAARFPEPRDGPAPYHHGNLRAALTESGVALAREGGPEAVVLREASRRARVSHSAAYRHFADREALLAAVAGEAASALARALERRIVRAPDARGRLRAVGTAYVRFALAEPGLFRTAFAFHAVSAWPDGTGVGERGLDPRELLTEVLDELEREGTLPAATRPGAEFAAWSAVHGLACLLIDGPLGTLPAAARDTALDRVLDHVEAGLLGRHAPSLHVDRS